MLYTLTIDLCFGDEAEFEAALGDHLTDAGPVKIASGTQQHADVVECKIAGSVPAIIAYLIAEWQDVDEALKAIMEAVDEGRLEMA